MPFPTTKPIAVANQPRLRQQDIAATAIKPFAFSQQLMLNTQAEILGPFAVNNGASLSILSIINNTVNEKFRVGSLPYNIVFFQTSLALSNVIGYGITGDYTINGPMGIPQFSPYAQGLSIGGNTGDNLVFLTELINNSGGSQTIYAITDTRVLTAIGGAST